MILILARAAPECNVIWTNAADFGRLGVSECRGTRRGRRPLITRIKICGITRQVDAEACVNLGADAIGLMFATGSPRRLDINAARAVAACVPPGLSRVGVFRDNPPDEIGTILEYLELDLLQFHGSETAEECARWEIPWLKAIGMSGGTDPVAVMAEYPEAAGYLLDGHVQGGEGGRGERFDWSRFPKGVERPLFLAGGLTPDNVYEAVRQARPFAVDVSSGVESSPGIKDPRLIEKFVEEVRRANSSEN